MIELYCGVGETRWNYEPVTPLGHACISPVAGKSARTKKVAPVTVPVGTEVIQDSGAFSDNWTERLTFAQAYERQLKHADRYRYEVAYRASYDLLIDEVWSEGNRTKRRWSVTQAEAAIDETVAAASWLNDHRAGTRLVLSAQGVDATQYLRCVERILPFFRPGDLLGLGGWCIIGKMPRVMMPVFAETVRLVIPFLAREGVERVHIWGVIYPTALGELLWHADQHGVKVSTDSSGVCLQPCFGQWGYGEWRDNSYRRPPTDIRGRERIRHLAMAKDWLTNYRQSPNYRPFAKLQQLALF